MSGVIPATVAANVLNFFVGDEGFGPGGYFSLIYRAAASADAENFNKLASIYPVEMYAFKMGQTDPNGLAKLRAIFNGED
jgi:hypothetical protein